MKKILSVLKRIYNFFPEFFRIAATILGWIASVYVIRFFDPTAGVFDAGIFQIPIFAIIQFFIYLAVVWIAIKLIFPTTRRYMEFDYQKDFNELTKWQKILLSFGIYFSLLAALVYLARTLSE